MKKSNKPRPKRPKGSYPLPNGNYVTKGRVDCSGKRAIWIEAVHKDPPDMEKLAKALLYLAEQLGVADDQNLAHREDDEEEYN